MCVPYDLYGPSWLATPPENRTLAVFLKTVEINLEVSLYTHNVSIKRAIVIDNYKTVVGLEPTLGRLQNGCSPNLSYTSIRSG